MSTSQELRLSGTPQKLRDWKEQFHVERSIPSALSYLNVLTSVRGAVQNRPLRWLIKRGTSPIRSNSGGSFPSFLPSFNCSPPSMTSLLPAFFTEQSNDLWRPVIFSLMRYLVPNSRLFAATPASDTMIIFLLSRGMLYYTFDTHFQHVIKVS